MLSCRCVLNWLAHIYLSEPTPEFRLGNILPDFLRANELRHLSPEIQRGIACHHRIDAFTDRHPLVRQSICRIPPPHRRFASVLVDMIYDHFLAANWSKYSDTSLPSFTAEIYRAFAPLAPHLPKAVTFALHRMSAQDWLSSYATLPGIELALSRISARFSRPVNLTLALPAIEKNYDALHADFREFFPALEGHITSPPSPPPHAPTTHPDHAASR